MLVCRATPIDAVLFKVLKQLEAGEIVVEEDMVVLVFQVLCQLHQRVCSKADFTIFQCPWLQLAHSKLSQMSSYDQF